MVNKNTYIHTYYIPFYFKSVSTYPRSPCNAIFADKADTYFTFSRAVILFSSLLSCLDSFPFLLSRFLFSFFHHAGLFCPFPLITCSWFVISFPRTYNFLLTQTFPYLPRFFLISFHFSSTVTFSSPFPVFFQPTIFSVLSSSSLSFISFHFSHCSDLHYQSVPNDTYI